jgi:hypothetical protein
MIVRIEECTAAIAVVVALSELTPFAGFAVSGDVFESDEPEGDDYCGSLDPQSTPAGAGPACELLLTGNVMATDLGLLQGKGPARDEVSNPQRVQIFARVWLRTLDTGERLGPWESPRLVAVPNPRFVWTPRESLPGRELMTPRRRSSISRHDSIGLPLPPEACNA